jgi:hypothetical protein
MGKLKYLIIHCTATPAGRDVTGDDIRQWHLVGRGWSQVGYSDLIHLDGEIENLVEYNGDNWVDSGEITNGAQGYNGVSQHVCVVGGQDEDGNDLSRQGDFEDMLTPEQFTALQEYTKRFVSQHSQSQIMGHYMVNSHKDCPGFDVQKFLRFIEISEENIYQL